MKKLNSLAGILAAMIMIACADAPTAVGTPFVARVDLQPAPAPEQFFVGDTIRLTALPRSIDGAVLGSVPITWRVVGDGAITVDPSGATGLVTALGPGEARVEAESNGRIGFVTFTVMQRPRVVATVEIIPTALQLTIGQTATIEAIARNGDGSVIAGQPIVWTSTYTPWATVIPIGGTSQATVTALGAGTLKIRATIGGVQAEMPLSIAAPQIPVANVFLAPSRYAMWVNSSTDYSGAVRVLASNGSVLTGRVVTWSVDNPAVLSVNENGFVQAVGAGTTKLWAHSEGKSGFAEIVVYALSSGDQVYNLTYDWWDGEFHVVPAVGNVLWTDALGVEHNLPLYLTEGTLTLRDNGTYQRVLRLTAWAVVNGSALVAAQQELVDEGNVYIMVGGETGYTLVSTTSPGLQNAVVSGGLAGHLIVRQQIGSAGLMPYMFRLQQ